MSKWNPLQKAENSNTFCVFPWIHQYVGTLGDVKPCCVYDHKTDLGNLKENSLKEIWNNEKTKALRLKMLNGEVIDECQHCNVREFLNETHRTNTNAVYFPQDNVKEQISNTQKDGTVLDHRLLYIDVRFNNLCNFKCRTCSPHFSTSIINDYRKVHKISSDEKKNNELQFAGRYESHAIEEILQHIDYVQEVYFAGGEPLMQSEHYDLLTALIENNNNDFCIRYNTNLSNLSLHNKNVLEYWKKIKNVRVLASLDASYKRAEYWRKGTNWNNIVENRKKIINQTPHVKFFICCTLSWPNSYDIVEFHKEWVEQGLIGINDIYLNELGGPEYYALNVLPLWKKDKIKKIYEDHIQWLINYPENTESAEREFKNAIKFIYESQTEKFPCKDFHYYTTEYDKLRKEKFFEVFPEHNDMKEYLEEHGYREGF